MRTIRVTFLLSPNDKEILEKLCFVNGLSQSEMVRTLILKEARREGIADSFDVNESGKDKRRKREGFQRD